jgi:antitoxin VapB
MGSNVARVFTTGGSQAIRLPVEYRFEGKVVYVRRDEMTGDVILSARPQKTTWDEFLTLRDAAASESADFLTERDQTSEVRNPLRKKK